MKKKEIIKKSQEFDSIMKKNIYVKNKEFVIYYCDTTFAINRFGISVGKKIGNAVTRNYYKRIIRNICDLNKKNICSKNKDYIIIIRKGCTLKKFDEINKSYVYLMNIIKEKEKK